MDASVIKPINIMIIIIVQDTSIESVCQGIQDKEARQIQRALLVSQLFSAIPPLEAVSQS